MTVRNAHLEYAITWFSLSLIGLVVYILWHRRFRPADRNRAGGAAADRGTLMRFTGTYQRPLGGESAVLIREGDLHVLPLPTDDPLDALTRLRHIEDGVFRRVRDNGDLGEQFRFEALPDGRMLMWRNDNYSVRAAGM